jgi:hypothetical protein
MVLWNIFVTAHKFVPQKYNKKPNPQIKSEFFGQISVSF